MKALEDLMPTSLSKRCRRLVGIIRFLSSLHTLLKVKAPQCYVSYFLVGGPYVDYSLRVSGCVNVALFFKIPSHTLLMSVLDFKLSVKDFQVLCVLIPNLPLCFYTFQIINPVKLKASVSCADSVNYRHLEKKHEQENKENGTFY